MESIFVYDRPVSGKLHVGRRADVEKLCAMLREGRHALLVAPPKAGKTSLVRQAFAKIASQKEQFTALEASLMGPRTLKELLLDLGSQMICCVASSQQEIAEAVFRFFGGTSYEFDFSAYRQSGRVLNLQGEPSDEDMRAVFELPERIAKDTGRRVYLVLDEFQDIRFTGCPERLLEAMKGALERSRGCTFVVCGSMVNAMKDIFPAGAESPFEPFRLGPVQERDIKNYVIKSFLNNGKVIEEDQVGTVCDAVKCNIWYVNHFCAICDGISKGYVTNALVRESLGALTAVHEPRFRSMMADLTNFQLSFLKAVLEGCTKFSSNEVIERYGLNSSANVSRIKDALCKKEIISLEEGEQPLEILDPLFEYWAAEYYFKTRH